MSLEGLELRFGGRRSDEERLAAAALPVLDRLYSEGVFEVPGPAEAAASAAS